MRHISFESLEIRDLLAADGVPISPALVGDVDADGEVGFTDFLIVSKYFGESGVAPEQGDLTGDSNVDFDDFLQLSGNYGRIQEDVNQDGDLTLDDAYIVRDAVLASAEYDAALDVNADCLIDKLDIQAVSDKLRKEQGHPADIDLSGAVDEADFAIIDANFGKQVIGGWIDGDIDEDGEVGFADLLLTDPSPF